MAIERNQVAPEPAVGVPATGVPTQVNVNVYITPAKRQRFSPIRTAYKLACLPVSIGLWLGTCFCFCNCCCHKTTAQVLWD